MTPSVEDAFVYCEKLARSHYENFTVASFLLPRKLRRPFFAVYAYCRHSDDLADESATPAIALERLYAWEKDLDRCFQGEAEHPIFVALREIIVQHRLPKEPFADLLSAFRRDQTQQRYETLDDLLDYCRCSANPVGRIILYLAASAAGTPPPDEEMLGYSDAVCTGLQLANFWQDVARDWEKGRLYIPKGICRNFGYLPKEIFPEEPGNIDRFDNKETFRTMMGFLVDDARERLRFGRALVRRVPRFLRTDIALFADGGLAILEAIEKIRFDVWKRRPTVSKGKKLLLLLKALLR